MVFVSFKDSLNAFLKSNAFYIALAIVAVIVITFVALIIMNRKKKK